MESPDYTHDMTTLACFGKTEELVKMLEEHKGEIDFQRINAEGHTPFTQCVQSGCRMIAANPKSEQAFSCLDCAVLLIEHGSTINHADQEQYTALHWAAKLDSQQHVDILMQRGADPALLNRKNLNSLHLAVANHGSSALRAIVANTPPESSAELLESPTGDGYSPLTYAVKLGHIDVAEDLIQLGAKLNAPDQTPQKQPALHLAIETGNQEITELLIETYHADPLARDGQEQTAFYVATNQKDSWFFTYLVDSYQSGDLSAAMSAARDDGATPLMLACQEQKLQQVQTLLTKGVKITATDKGGKTALHYCTENSSPEIAEALLGRALDLMDIQDNDGYSPLHMAVIAQNGPLVRLLLDQGVAVNAKDKEEHNAVHWATVCGHLDMMEVLLAHKADANSPDVHHAFPLHYAAQMCGANTTDGEENPLGLNVLKKLLERRVPVDCADSDQRRPLLWAASSGSRTACRLLVDAGANVDAADKDGLRAIHCAASRGFPACVKDLVKLCRCPVDSLDKNNCSPLFYAITLGHTECAITLLDLGADTSLTDKKGRSAAHCAAAKGNMVVLRRLKEKSAPLYLSSLKSEYPLHEACQQGQQEAVEFLLPEAPSSDTVDAPNQDGRTCLHQAAIAGKLPIIKLLVEKGAKVNVVMKYKERYLSPYDAAKLKNHKDCAEYLQSVGCAPGNKITKHAARVIQRGARRASQSQLEASPRPKSPPKSSKSKSKSSEPEPEPKQQRKVSTPRSAKVESEDEKDKRPEEEADDEETEDQRRVKSARRRRRPRTPVSERALEIQQSVARYETVRQYNREIHRSKKAQMNSAPATEAQLVQKLVKTFHQDHPQLERGGDDVRTFQEWEGYLTAQLQKLEDDGERNSLSSSRRNLRSAHPGDRGRRDQQRTDGGRSGEQQRTPREDKKEGRPVPNDPEMSRLVTVTDSQMDTLDARAQHKTKESRENNRAMQERLDGGHQRSKSAGYHKNWNKRRGDAYRQMVRTYKPPAMPAEVFYKDSPYYSPRNSRPTTASGAGWSRKNKQQGLPRIDDRKSRTGAQSAYSRPTEGMSAAQLRLARRNEGKPDETNKWIALLQNMKAKSRRDKHWDPHAAEED